MSVNLTGEWIGYYRGHFDQVIKFDHNPDTGELVATKITGDNHVPGGEITFKCNTITGLGTGQVAEKEFRNTTWVPGVFKMLSPDKVSFAWDNCGTVEFRRDD